MGAAHRLLVQENPGSTPARVAIVETIEILLLERVCLRWSCKKIGKKTL
jgi:hypothetical protein